MLVVILILVVFAFILLSPPRKYTWRDFKQKFGNRNIEYASYDFTMVNDEYGNPHVMKHIESDTFFTNRNIQSCMLKLKDGEHKHDDILEYVRPLCTTRDEKFGLRIQKGPWYWTSHFDCIDQVCHILEGRKKWVLYEASFATDDEEKQFVDIVGYLTTLDALMTHLDSVGIKYQVVHTKPGDKLFIKAGVYHAVEAKGNHVMVNEYVSDDYKNLTPRFAKIWNRWYHESEKY